MSITPSELTDFKRAERHLLAWAVAFLFSQVIVSAAMAEAYRWSLSGSGTDPNVNTASPTAPGEPFAVYLWLACAAPWTEVQAVEFSIATDWLNDGFTPLNGALSGGDDTNLLLAIVGCPRDPFPMGVWAFRDPAGLGGSACLVADPAGINGTAACQFAPIVYPNAVTGFTTDGSNPCLVGECEGPVPVGSPSWGATKGLYR